MVKIIELTFFLNETDGNETSGTIEYCDGVFMQFGLATTPFRVFRLFSHSVSPNYVSYSLPTFSNGLYLPKFNSRTSKNHPDSRYHTLYRFYTGLHYFPLSLTSSHTVVSRRAFTQQSTQKPKTWAFSKAVMPVSTSKILAMAAAATATPLAMKKPVLCQGELKIYSGILSSTVNLIVSLTASICKST